MKTGNKILGKNEEKKRLGRDHEIMENQKKKITWTVASGIMFTL